ncbi:squalene/phytoene synthase family protein [Aerophototrophica crusticola]|uniref:Squalene/phytoene synthase family protein n=1 Tax=Aerophototrophica crusticola TaxID=1709002 RepID=A0A858R6B2_9PROT|nr:squalene/phytoene synthase family protein [Rhodospirillaceae bacterium B3]
MADPTLSYCADQVRRFDNDRFLTALFAPANRREDLFALYAFNLEVAKTREVVTEPMLGQIRLQWWRDTIDQIYAGQERRHEVVQPLGAAVRRHGLERALFDRLVDAREADLDDSAPASLDCLVNYANSTAAPLVQLASQVLGVNDAPAMQAARHVGIAWALTGILRSVPFLARAHRTRLPADLMATHGVMENALFDGKAGPGLAAVVKEVAAVARDHLAQARALRREVPKVALPALLPATLADLYLGVLAREGHDPSAARVQLQNPFRQVRLGWAALTGRW